MKHIAALLIVGMLSCSDLASAQGYTPPSDTELSAAYCLGFETRRHERMPGPAVPAVQSIEGKHLDKLRDYLVSKGWLSPGRDSLPFMIATGRGERDLDQCLADIQAQHSSGQIDVCERKTAACIKMQQTRDPSLLEACAAACRPESCKPALMCNSLKLPY